MYTLVSTNQFEKDYKLCLKRGYKVNLLSTLIEQLEKSGTVANKYKPHKLTCNYKGFWECHIRPDWLLIWLDNSTTNTIHSQEMAQIQTCFNKNSSYRFIN